MACFNNNKGEYEFPYQIQPVDPVVNEELLRDFRGRHICVIKWCKSC